MSAFEPALHALHALKRWRRLAARRSLFGLLALAALLAPMAGLVHGVLHGAPAGLRMALVAAVPTRGAALPALQQDPADPAATANRAAPVAPFSVGALEHEAGSADCRLLDQLLSAAPVPYAPAELEFARPHAPLWRAAPCTARGTPPYQLARARGPPPAA